MGSHKNNLLEFIWKSTKATKKAYDDEGRGYYFRNNNYEREFPLELIIRENQKNKIFREKLVKYTKKTKHCFVFFHKI